MIIGLLVGGIAWIMPVTVDSEVGLVANLHRMNIRQSLLITGGFLFLAGIVMRSAAALLEGVAKIVRASSDNRRPVTPPLPPIPTERDNEKVALEALGLKDG